VPCCGVPILYHFRAIAALQRGRGRPIVESHRAFNRALRGVWPSTRLRGVKPAKFSVKSKMIFFCRAIVARLYPPMATTKRTRTTASAWDARPDRNRQAVRSRSSCLRRHEFQAKTMRLGGVLSPFLGPGCRRGVDRRPQHPRPILRRRWRKPSMHTAGVLSWLLCRTALSDVTCLRQ